MRFAFTPGKVSRKARAASGVRRDAAGESGLDVGALLVAASPRKLMRRLATPCAASSTAQAFRQVTRPVHVVLRSPCSSTTARPSHFPRSGVTHAPFNSGVIVTAFSRGVEPGEKQRSKEPQAQPARLDHAGIMQTSGAEGNLQKPNRLPTRNTRTTQKIFPCIPCVPWAIPITPATGFVPRNRSGARTEIDLRLRALAASSFATCSFVRFQPTAPRLTGAQLLLKLRAPMIIVATVSGLLQQPVERHLRHALARLLRHDIEGVDDGVEILVLHRRTRGR